MNSNINPLTKTFYYTYVQIFFIACIYILFFYLGVTIEKAETSFLILLFILDICLLLFCGNTIYEIVYKNQFPLATMGSKLSIFIWVLLWFSLIAGFLISFVSHTMMLITFTNLNNLYTKDVKLANDMNIPLVGMERRSFNYYKSCSVIVISLFILLFCLLINNWLPESLFKNIGSFLSYLLIFSVFVSYIIYIYDSIIISNTFWPLNDRVIIQ